VLLAKLLGLVVVLNGLGVVIVALIGDAYLRYAYSPEYAVYLPELVIASITAVVLGLANMLSQTLTALSRFRLQLWLNLAALSCSVGVGLWLIPRRGIEGAIETLLVLAGFRLVLYSVANFAVGPRAVGPRSNTDRGSP
jgi:O-antigen/teichoic acid export membrane protein